VPGVLILIGALTVGNGEQPTLVFLGIIVIMIPTVVVVTAKQLAYSQALYILADHPGIGCLDAITASRELMDGYKAKLFRLMLRFVGWALLCIFTLFIGLIWLIPYMGAAMAAFYDDLQPPPKTAGPGRPDPSSQQPMLVDGSTGR
jgi:uncharacterized membrane protein